MKKKENFLTTYKIKNTEKKEEEERLKDNNCCELIWIQLVCVHNFIKNKKKIIWNKERKWGSLLVLKIKLIT